jgi:hypothetical protein
MNARDLAIKYLREDANIQNYNAMQIPQQKQQTVAPQQVISTQPQPQNVNAQQQQNTDTQQEVTQQNTDMNIQQQQQNAGIPQQQDISKDWNVDFKPEDVEKNTQLTQEEMNMSIPDFVDSYINNNQTFNGTGNRSEYKSFLCKSSGHLKLIGNGNNDKGLYELLDGCKDAAYSTPTGKALYDTADKLLNDILDKTAAAEQAGTLSESMRLFESNEVNAKDLIFFIKLLRKEDALLSKTSQEEIKKEAENDEIDTKEDVNKEEGNQEESKSELDSSGEKNSILIWPGNPFLSKDEGCMKAIAEAEALFKEKKLVGEQVYIFVPNNGANGNFSASSLQCYLHNKAGLQSAIKSTKEFNVVTSVNTVLHNIQQTIAKNKEIGNKSTGQSAIMSESCSEKKRRLLFEDDFTSGNIKPNVGTTSTAGNNTQNKITLGINSEENFVKIYMAPEMVEFFMPLMEKGAKLFDLLGNEITKKEDAKSTSIENQLDLGKTIFKELLSYKNGMKVKDSGDNKGKININPEKSVKSPTKNLNLGSLKDSIIYSGKRLYEADEQQQEENNQSQQEKPNEQSSNEDNGNDSGDWSWENVRNNKGAKQYLSAVMADAEACEKGLGTEPKKDSFFKRGMAAVLQKYTDAGADAVNLALQTTGLGWLSTFIKKGAEKQDTESNKLKDFLKSKESKTLLMNSGLPEDYVEWEGVTN